jgi:son of sevenless-like protein
MSLVSDTILTERDVKKRAAALKFFIKLAVRAPESVLLTSDSDRLSPCLQNRLLDVRNFSAAFAVVGSLNGSSITRLKKTWEVSLCERMRSR